MSVMAIEESNTDQRLIEKCLRNDRQAQRELYEKYSRKMFVVCLRYASNREMAEDFLQDGFVKIFGNLTKYEGKGSFEGWMKRIFINTSLEQLRRNDLLRDSSNIDDAYSLTDSQHSIVDTLAAEEILRLVQELPPGYRAVFNLHVVEGYDHREVAEQLGISESTSRSQFVRARQLLQTKLQSLK